MWRVCVNRKGHGDLEDYARRRFVLSGTSVVKDHFPYCRSMEDLRVDPIDRRHGGVASFAHYDYLALGSDPRIRSAAIDAIESLGVGANASRLVGGERALHRLLEQELAKFPGVEDTLSLVSGYGTNVAVVSHLLPKSRLIPVDEAAHKSILIGTHTFAPGDI